MKRALAALAAALLAAIPAFAADEPDPHAELKALVGRINDKLQGSPKSEEELAPELEEFDKLLASFKEGEEDAAAQATLMKGMLYIQVFQQPGKGAEIIKSLKTKYPTSKEAGAADKILASIDETLAAQKIQASLAPGAEFPNFEVTDLDGKPLSIAGLKGKVVLIDFWATWCDPFVQELPTILAAYEKYHDQGFEIVGISLDQDKEALTKFIAEHEMTWPQFFDGKGWQNELAKKYGIRSVPASYLLDKDGKIIASGLRGEGLIEAVGKAVGGA